MHEYEKICSQISNSPNKEKYAIAADILVAFLENMSYEWPC